MVTTIIYKCRKFQMRRHSWAALLRITFCLHILHFLKSESTGLKRFFLDVSNLFSPTWYYNNAAEKPTSHSAKKLNPTFLLPPAAPGVVLLELPAFQGSGLITWQLLLQQHDHCHQSWSLLTILNWNWRNDPDNSPFPAFPSSRTSHKPSFLWRKNSSSLAWWSFGQDWFLIPMI